MTTASRFPVINPWTGERVDELASTTPDAVYQATGRASNAAQSFRDSTPFDRRALLFSIANAVEREADRLALLICAEVGKTIKEARREVARTLITVRLSAEAAGQMDGEILHCSVAEKGPARLAAITYQPVGVVAAIDPKDLATAMGPVIDEAAGVEVSRRIHEAVELGAQCLWGQVQSADKANRIVPNVLDDVPVDARLWALETFGPVLAVRRFADVDLAVDEVNRSGFGLQAGICSNNHEVIKRMSHRLEVGGVMVNEGSDFRVEHVPFGGIKSSGMGREGVRIAMREMSELKVVVD